VVAARSAREASDGGPAPPGGPAAARCKGIDANSFSGNVMDHAALRHGFPQTSYVAASEAFVASFDFRTRNAQWVVEHLTSESVRLDEAERKGETFHEASMARARRQRPYGERCGRHSPDAPRPETARRRSGDASLGRWSGPSRVLAAASPSARVAVGGPSPLRCQSASVLG